MNRDETIYSMNQHDHLIDSASSFRSRLRPRIFLDTNRGVDGVIFPEESQSLPVAERQSERRALSGAACEGVAERSLLETSSNDGTREQLLMGTKQELNISRKDSLDEKLCRKADPDTFFSKLASFARAE